MDANATTSDATFTNRTVRSQQNSSNPVVIVIDEEQDSNRNFSANIFVIPCGESIPNNGPISLNGGDVGSLVLEVDDSDPESSCTCTIECWVHDTDAQNRPKTKVNLCPRCAERANRRRQTTLSLAVSRNSYGSSEASASSSSLASENQSAENHVDNQKRMSLDVKSNHPMREVVSSVSRLRSKLLRKRKQQYTRCKSLGKFKCFKCRKVVPTSDRLRKHLKEHDTRKHYPCPHCSRIFRLRPSAALHILREHKT